MSDAPTGAKIRDLKDLSGDEFADLMGHLDRLAEYEALETARDVSEIRDGMECRWEEGSLEFVDDGGQLIAQVWGGDEWVPITLPSYE